MGLDKFATVSRASEAWSPEAEGGVVLRPRPPGPEGRGCKGKDSPQSWAGGQERTGIRAAAGGTGEARYSRLCSLDDALAIGVKKIVALGVAADDFGDTPLHLGEAGEHLLCRDTNGSQAPEGQPHAGLKAEGREKGERKGEGGGPGPVSPVTCCLQPGVGGRHFEGAQGGRVRLPGPRAPYPGPAGRYGASAGPPTASSIPLGAPSAFPAGQGLPPGAPGGRATERSPAGSRTSPRPADLAGLPAPGRWPRGPGR